MNTLADRFVLESEIARGAVGVVWRGTDRVTGRSVAVKFLREELRGDPAVVESFFAEAEVLGAIDHPGVVEVRDFVHTDSVLAVVLELIDGLDLREHLRIHGPLPAAEAAARCASAAETLAAVHRAGFLHGDVKPGNLMLDGDDGAKFIDFGIARAAESTSLPSHGTPEYTAPEVASGASACPGIDNYALGLVLYEALTGRSAYRGGSITDVLDRHLTRIPVKPAAVDPELWAVVETLLSLDPERRGDLDRIAAELRRLAPGLADRATAPIEPELRDRHEASAVAHSPVTPPAPGPRAEDVRERARPGRRHLLPVGAGALGLAAAVAFVFFALPGGGSGEGENVADPPTAEASESPDEPDKPTAEASEEPDGGPSETDGPEGPGTDSGTPGAETDDLSDSEGGGNAPDESNEGAPVDQMPGSDVIGSPLPGN
ncbi:protein kinase domain-containing protein [Glycomyces xiaoerkulensis]|uniref:protein kinase domain-containing protein n=1 Tax=Glycomyces xiaoerkulensis TaxID=2038139 RepID=UPI000C26A0E3|nr:serine/threonine-protein kinase [Glycomyces xiaoerkulensis]